jgi:hypothetical protein
MKRQLIHMILLAIALPSSGREAQVIWGAAVANSVATAEGVDLPTGDLALIGSFDLTPSQIQADASNLSLLQANFVPYASAQIGQGNPAGTTPAAPGFWLADTTASTDAVSVANTTFNIAHTQIYYWIFNAPTAAAATEQGIFTAPGNNNWIFPDDNDLINITTTDISEVPTTGILVGSFGVSTSPLTGAPQYNLAVIPEPYEGMLLAVSGVALLGYALQRRARR